MEGPLVFPWDYGPVTEDGRFDLVPGPELPPPARPVTGVIVGTAGHVDHGKTSLVKALTGIDTDRLPEEKRRGITLELGFAHLTLPDGTVAGVVDVPGHERFVKAMAAGAGGVDLAILVVAADEGVMPQTREHLDICQLLGVRAGVVALTKADLLPGLGDDWRSLLDADLATLLAGSVLEKAEVVPVSARTGEGLDALRAALGRAAATVPRRPADGPLFLPIDRAFTIKGFGTVVTGTLLSGTVEPEASVSLLPGLPGPFRVRGVQTHGQTRGARLGGSAHRGEPPRGGDAGRPAGHGAGPRGRAPRDTLAGRGAHPARRGRGAAPAPPHAPPPPRHGAGRGAAHLARPAGAPAGETGLAQLRLQAPVAALPGQRFILRGRAAVARARGDARRRTGADHRRATPAPRGAAELLAPMRGEDLDARLIWLARQSGYRGHDRRASSRSGRRARRRRCSVRSTCSAARGRCSSSTASGASTSPARPSPRSRHVRWRCSSPSTTGRPLEDALHREELRQRLSADLDPRLLGRLVQALVERGAVEAIGEGCG